MKKVLSKPRRAGQGKGEPAAKALTTYLNKGRKHLMKQWLQIGKKPTAVFLASYDKARYKRASYNGRLTERSIQLILEVYATKVGIEKRISSMSMSTRRKNFYSAKNKGVVAKIKD